MVDRLDTRNLIIVTGGLRGIGLAITSLLIESGIKVVVWSRQRVKDYGPFNGMADVENKIRIQKVDVKDRGAVKLALHKLSDEAGRITGLVNNAGILQQKSFELITDAEWQLMCENNLQSVFIIAQELFPILKMTGGCMVNIASSGGQLGGMLAVHYAASKAGIICLTKSLARIGAPFGVRVNCVSPGLIETDMTKAEINSDIGLEKITTQIPLRRVGNAQEVAAAVRFLLSPSASYITGVCLNVNGGLYMK